MKKDLKDIKKLLIESLTKQKLKRKGDTMSYYIIYSKKVARELERSGFAVIKMEPNIKYPDRMVYFFEDTVELRRAIQPLINRR